MAFDFIEYYRLALSTHGATVPEAVSRSAASRAYYSFFISARVNANLQARQASYRETHEHYKDLPGAVNRKIYNNLYACHELRKRADYEISPPFDAQLAQRALNLSKDGLKALGLTP